MRFHSSQLSALDSTSGSSVYRASLIHATHQKNYITCGQIQSRKEDFTCTIHLPSLTSHALDVQSRICKSDLIPRRLPRRIFGHDFTVWRGTATDGRPDTHSDPDATLCPTSSRWRQGCFKHFLASTDQLKSYEKVAIRLDNMPLQRPSSFVFVTARNSCNF